MSETTTPSIDGVPLDEIETLTCRCGDGVAVEAARRKDLPWPDIFMGRHPGAGLCFFRVRRRGAPNSHPGPGCESGEIEVWECTEAVRRALQRRRDRLNERAKEALARAKQGDVKADAKPGSPTPGRRRRGAEQGLPIERVVAPKREAASDAALVYNAPDNLARLHRNGTITNNMLHAAARFHGDWLRAGLDQLRAANLMRVARDSGGEATAVLNARHQVHRVCDRLGGYGSPGFQALIHVVGEAMTVAAWSSGERSGPWRLDPNKAAGVLLTALGVLEGFYRPRPEAPNSAG